MPRPLGISGGNPLQVKYLKILWGQEPLTPLWRGERWTNFVTRLGHHFGHWSHSSLQTEIQFGFKYRDTWWWIHLLQCLFWSKVYFSSAFSKSKWWKRNFSMHDWVLNKNLCKVERVWSSFVTVAVWVKVLRVYYSRYTVAWAEPLSWGGRQGRCGSTCIL